MTFSDISFSSSLAFFLPNRNFSLSQKQIKAEFEKFHHFLRKEEKARLRALKKEVEKKQGKVKERIEKDILRLSDKVREMEEEMETEDSRFMQVKLLAPLLSQVA